MANVRNSHTTHPNKTARQEGALSRLFVPYYKKPTSDQLLLIKRKQQEEASLVYRIGKPPRSW